MPYKSLEDRRKLYRRIYEKNRNKTLEILGGSCKNCGISDYDILQVDHIEPINKDRMNRICNEKLFKKIANGSLSVENLQILCANCHMKKTVAEHRKKRK